MNNSIVKFLAVQVRLGKLSLAETGKYKAAVEEELKNRS